MDDGAGAMAAAADAGSPAVVVGLEVGGGDGCWVGPCFVSL